MQEQWTVRVLKLRDYDDRNYIFKPQFIWDFRSPNKDDIRKELGLLSVMLSLRSSLCLYTLFMPVGCRTDLKIGKKNTYVWNRFTPVTLCLVWFDLSFSNNFCLTNVQ